MNPFRFGEVVVKEDFCPRPQLVAMLREHIGSGHKSVILGERRTGKTSLIFESVRRTRGLRLVYAQFWAVKSVADVADRLLKGISTMESKGSFLAKTVELLSHLRPTLEYDSLSGTPSLSLAPGTKLLPSGLHAVFDVIAKLAERTRLAVALDEFQDIRGLADSEIVLGEIRGRIQRQRGIPYIFAGSVRHEMEEIFHHPRSPFYKSFRTIEVGALPSEVFRDFLDKRFQSGQRKLSVDAWKEVLRLAEGSPSDTQQLCAAVWDTSGGGQTIELEDINTALRHIFSTERKGYESLVRPLTDNQLRCLRGLAKLGGAQPQSKRFLAVSGIPLPASVKRCLTKLIQSEIIYGSEKEHKFFDPFFRQWILSQF